MGGTAIKANQDLMRSSERNATLSGVSGAAQDYAFVRQIGEGMNSATVSEHMKNIGCGLTPEQAPESMRNTSVALNSGDVFLLGFKEGKFALMQDTRMSIAPDGKIKNASGFSLKGYKVGEDGTVIQGMENTLEINTKEMHFGATSTTYVNFRASLPASEKSVVGAHQNFRINGGNANSICATNSQALFAAEDVTDSNGRQLAIGDSLKLTIDGKGDSTKSFTYGGVTSTIKVRDSEAKDFFKNFQGQSFTIKCGNVTVTATYDANASGSSNNQFRDLAQLQGIINNEAKKQSRAGQEITARMSQHRLYIGSHDPNAAITFDGDDRGKELIRELGLTNVAEAGQDEKRFNSFSSLQKAVRTEGSYEVSRSDGGGLKIGVKNATQSLKFGADAMGKHIVGNVSIALDGKGADVPAQYKASSTKRQVIITSANHGLSDGDIVHFDGLGNVTQNIGEQVAIKRLSDDQFAVFTNNDIAENVFTGAAQLLTDDQKNALKAGNITFTRMPALLIEEATNATGANNGAFEATFANKYIFGEGNTVNVYLESKDNTFQSGYYAATVRATNTVTPLFTVDDLRTKNLAGHVKSARIISRADAEGGFRVFEGMGANQQKIKVNLGNRAWGYTPGDVISFSQSPGLASVKADTTIYEILEVDSTTGSIVIDLKENSGLDAANFRSYGAVADPIPVNFKVNNISRFLRGEFGVNTDYSNMTGIGMRATYDPSSPDGRIKDAHGGYNLRMQPGAKNSICQLDPAIVYTSLGTAVTIVPYMAKIGENTWACEFYELSEDGNFEINTAGIGGNIVEAHENHGYLGGGILTFDANGNLVSGMELFQQVSLSFTNGAAEQKVDFNMGYPTDGTTTADGKTMLQQLGNSLSMHGNQSDGNTNSFIMDSIHIDKEGNVIGRVKGMEKTFYKLAVAKVNNKDGLVELAAGVYQATSDSGQPMLMIDQEMLPGYYSAHKMDSVQTITESKDLAVLIQGQTALMVNMLDTVKQVISQMAR